MTLSKFLSTVLCESAAVILLCAVRTAAVGALHYGNVLHPAEAQLKLDSEKREFHAQDDALAVHVPLGLLTLLRVAIHRSTLSSLGRSCGNPIYFSLLSVLLIALLCYADPKGFSM